MGRNRKDISQVILEFDVDERQLSNSLKAADSVLSRYKALSADAGKLKDAVSGVRQAMEVQAKGLDDLGVGTNRAGRNLQEVVDDMQRAESQARQGARAIDDYGDAYRNASRQVESFGDVSTNLSQLSGLARGVGLGGVADVGMLGADIFDAVEGLGRLGPALRGVGTQIQSAIQASTGFEVSLGAIGVAGGVAVAAVAAVGVALAAFTEANKEAVRGVEAYIAAQRELAGILPDLTEEQRIERINSLNDAIEANQARVDLLQRSYDQVTNGLGILTNVADALNEQGIRGMREEMETLRAQILKDNITLADLRGEVGQNAVTATEAAQKERDLAEARTQGAQAAAEAAVAEARSRDSQAARDYAASLNDALDAQRDAIQFERQLKDIRARSAQQAQALRDQSSERVDSLRAQFAKAEDAASKAIAKVQTDAAKKRASIEKDFMQKALDDSRQYLEKERRAQEDFARDRVRLIEDINDDLLSAEEDNNIIRFIQIQRQGQKDLRRLDENASVDEKRRSEDFQAEVKQRRDEAAQRLQDLRDDSQERINEIRQGLRDQRSQLDEQINQESQALKVRLELNRQALQTELLQRRQQHAIQLADEAYYAQKRLEIERGLQSQLLAIAQQNYSSIYKQAVSKPYSTGTSLSSYLAGRTLPSTGGTVVYNFSGMQVGSDLSRNEVQNSLTSWGTAIMSGTLKGLSGKVAIK